MIISLHIPKTAGKSFKKALTIEYGSNIFFDYGFNPQKSYSNFQKYFSNRFKKYQVNLLPKEIEVVHGHFCLDRYKSFSQKAPRICFARDPLPLLISFYDYLNIKAKSEPKIKRYYKKIIDSKLEEFLLSDHAQSFYLRMFGSFDYRQFSFIGIVERYEESIKLFNKMFGTSLVLLHVNKTNSIKNKICESDFSNDFINRFRKFHKFNYEFYDYALSTFENKI